MIPTWMWLFLFGWGPVLPGPTYITNTFGTYRPHRFHTGLDLSTHGKVGIPLRTPQDGRVWRIVTSYLGYGRALYLKTRSGNIVVFAHLSRFRSDLHQWVYQRQIALQSYFLDQFPGDTFQIPMGQVIGYSGESGWGPPHLHLEVRTSDNRPVNPLAFFPLPDHKAPQIHTLRLVPVSPVTKVEGDPWPKEIQITSATGNLPRVTVVGPIGLEVQATDRTDESPYDLLPYEVFAGFGQETLVVIRFDTLDFEEELWSEWVFRYTGGSYSRAWLRLYTPMDQVPMPYKKTVQGFVVDKPETLWVYARDFSGNAATVKVLLVPGHPDVSIHSLPPAWHWRDHNWKMWVGRSGAWLWENDPQAPLFFQGECLEPSFVTDSGALFHLNREGPYESAIFSSQWMLFKVPPEGRTDTLWGWYLRFPPGSVPETTWVLMFPQLVHGSGEVVGRDTAIVLVGGETPVIQPFTLTPPSTPKQLYWIGDSVFEYISQPVRWGRYAELRDTMSPRIRILSHKTLRVQLVDEGSGIKLKSLQVWIDGRWYPAEYDPDQGLVFAPYSIRPGNHHIRITVEDRAGNSVNRTFLIQTPRL